MSYWSINKGGDYEVTMSYKSNTGRGGVLLKSSTGKFSVVIK